MKVFFDTNVLVSALTTRGLSADLMRLVIARHELVTGEVNLTEFRRVLRDRFKMPASAIHALEQALRQHTVIPRPATPSDHRIRDPDDAWVLASAIAGDVDILVTGDKDLLTIAEAVSVPVLDPRSCWDRLRRARS